MPKIIRLSNRRHYRPKISNLRAKVSNLYLIEEPTVGLHLEDVQRLIDVLHRLVDEGHTVIVIHAMASVTTQRRLK